ncbi:MAG: hypothetical protein ACRDJT_14805 [Actinomycetota bacterium]
MKKEALTSALEEIRAVRAAREARLEELEEEATALFGELEGLRHAEDSISRLLGAATVPQNQMKFPTPRSPRPSANGFPRTADAVYEVLRDHQGRRMTATRIQEILGDEGKLNPDLKQPYGVVLESAKRLANRDPEVIMRRRNKKIYFSYRPQTEEKGEGNGDGS